MSVKILCVDDDPNILAAYKRHLRKKFNLETADSGNQGLDFIAKSGPYAVVVSDMQMPGMNGVDFLQSVRKKSPDTVRMMLTGQGDLGVAMDAVNKGNIFRFLTKPCPPEELSQALNAAIRQHELITAEKVLLEKTLSGAVKVLSDVLSIVNPSAFGRASRVRRLVRQICSQMGQTLSWKIELSSMLSQIGCVTVPEPTLAKVFQGSALKVEEMRMFASHPLVGKDLLSKIPRMEEIAEIISYQEKRYNGSGIPRDSRNGQQIPYASRLLKVALDYDVLINMGLAKYDAISEMESRAGWYDPEIFQALKDILNLEISYVVQNVRIDDLNTSMILAEDVKGTTGTLLIANGQEISKSLLLRLKNFAFTAGVHQPIKVLVPRGK
jgi:response regulator RpfG family c-di-GMP phosphodiesterase